MNGARSLLKSSKLEALLAEDDDDEVLLLLMMATLNSDELLLEAICHELQPRERGARICRALWRPYGDIWTDMIQVWPGFPGNKENEMYYLHFRMNKDAFYNIFERVRGTFCFCLLQIMAFNLVFCPFGNASHASPPPPPPLSA